MYNLSIVYDAIKNARNIAVRGISFDSVVDFDFQTAQVIVDTRHAYSETRYIAMGKIGTRLHVLVFTETDTGLRVISLRKANQREARHYEASP